MDVNPANLPSDPAVCHRMILDLLGAQQRLQRENEQLRHRLDQLSRAHFGVKSEKLDPEQLLLLKDLLEKLPEAAPAPKPLASTPSAPRPGHGRRPLPEHLPREVRELDVLAEEKTCKKCGAEMARIGEETKEMLDYKPASLFVVEYRRAKYACRACQESVVTAEQPYQPIEKGLPGPGLLAQVVTSKYADHLPLNRQEGIFQRHGVEIPRSTQAGWMAAAAELLRPLYEIMAQEVRASRVMHTDDTPVPVQDEACPGRTKTGRLWVYVGDGNHPFTVYDYTPTRSRDGPEKFLGDYAGYLQADAFAGYDAMYRVGKIIEVACWAHARRKFYDAQGADSTRALAALAWIAKLYEVEAEGKGLSTPERQALRGAKSKPLLAGLGAWLEGEQAQVMPKSPMGEAIRYVLSNGAALERYTEDGDLDIDNNEAERALRAVAIGRKNWLFAGSDRGGRTAAILYSCVATCKRHGLDPFAWLRDVFARISAHPYHRLSEFLPHAARPS